jgi:hypothetical protein
MEQNYKYFFKNVEPQPLHQNDAYGFLYLKINNKDSQEHTSREKNSSKFWTNFSKFTNLV